MQGAGRGIKEMMVGAYIGVKINAGRIDDDLAQEASFRELV
jgi:hypothetical protein